MYVEYILDECRRQIPRTRSRAMRPNLTSHFGRETANTCISFSHLLLLIGSLPIWPPMASIYVTSTQQVTRSSRFIEIDDTISFLLDCAIERKLRDNPSPESKI